MNKKFLSAILFGALMVTSTGTFVSCKDYDDDIDSLQGQVDTNVSAIDALKSQLSSLQTAGSAAQAAADAAKATADAAKAAGDTAKAAAEEAKAAVAQAKADAIAEAAKQVEALKAIVEANKLSQDQLAAAIAPVAGQIEGIEAGLSDLKKLIDANGNEIAKALAEIEAIKADLALQKDVLEKLKETSTTDGAIDAKIEEVNETIALLYNELQSNIGSTASALQAFMDEYAVTMAAIVEKDNTLEANISLLTNTIMALNDKDDQLDTEISNVWAAINGTGGIQEQMTSLINRINDIDSYALTLHTLIGKNLTSLVFVPNLYLDGVEAARYPYADGDYFKAKTLGSDLSGFGDGATFVIKKGAKNSYEVETNSHYYMSSIDSIYYHLNPVNAKLDGIAWSLNSNDAETVSRAATQWTPQYKASAKNDGILSVAYSIKNPNKVSIEKELLSIMSLNAELPNDTIVNSDYSAILPAVRVWKAIGLTDMSKKAVDCTNSKLADELYAKGEDAATYEATIPVKYNHGAINLDTYFNIHYIQQDFTKPTSGEEQAMNYTTALENWGLKLVYELLPYTTGVNQTSEDKYGIIEDNLFYPCYVDSDGKAHKCDSNGGDTGISAVGKKPIVLVTLVDTNNNNKVVLSGYVKLQIVKDIKDEPIYLKPAFELPYICNWQYVEITWAQASDQIYEATKMSKDEFVKAYTPTWETFIYDAKKDEYVATTKYGFVYPQDDYNTGSTNEVVYWYGNIDHLNAIRKDYNGEITIFTKYASNSDIYNFYYIGITVKVLPNPEVTLGEKIERYWYPETIAVAERDTVKPGVPVPDDLNNVNTYVKDMDDYFVGNEVKPIKTSAAQNAKYTLKTLGTDYNYNYQFAVKQPNVGPYQLYLKKMGSGYDTANLYADNTDTKAVEDYLVATIDKNSGEVVYQQNDEAKIILNLFGHKDPKSAAANIEIVSTYGSCDIPLKNDIFTVRFQRPVSIVEGSVAKFEDAQANGSTVTLGDLLGLKDWRDETLIVKKGTKYVSAVENEKELYPYYEFKTIKIDTENALCDLNGKKQKVSEVTDALDLTTSGGTDISDVDAFNTIKITYKNNEGNVQKFNLWIPVELTYSWGTLKYEIKAEVSSTKGNAN